MTQLRTLVLNSHYQPLSLFPLSVTSAEDAIHNFFGGSCTILETYDEKIKTPSRDDLYWPSVIANHNAHSYRKEIRLKKESLYYRDHCICMYCGKQLTIRDVTIDHVIPESKGGKTTWDNAVAACKVCNNKKGDAISKKWVPRHKPWTPSFYEMLDIRKRYPIVVDHASWIPFLPNWSAPIIVKNERSFDAEEV